jgi:hypothetical protein
MSWLLSTSRVNSVARLAVLRRSAAPALGPAHDRTAGVADQTGAVLADGRSWLAMDGLPVPSITAVPANLLQISTAREPADAHSHPPKLGHSFRQTAARPGSSTALRHFENIEQQLRCNALDAIVADFTTQPFQRRPPGIARLGRGMFGLSLCFSESFHERCHLFLPVLCHWFHRVPAPPGAVLCAANLACALRPSARHHIRPGGQIRRSWVAPWEG